MRRRRCTFFGTLSYHRRCSERWQLGTSRLRGRAPEMSQERLVLHETPLFSSLLVHSERCLHRFHIPGHKGGRGVDPVFRSFIGENALKIDLINLEPLDDLHRPRGVIRKAQELAAAAFGADYSFFSVQGTSTAIMAMIMAVCREGEKILLPRNVHKSVMSALLLTGAIPVFLTPEIDEDLGVAHCLTLDIVRRALDAHPDARALLVVHPTYYGMCGDLSGIVELAHARGIPVLVDEAHGGHFYFHDRLPLAAMQAGADAAAVSMHKLCGSLTQTSILNIQGSRVSPERVQVMLSVLTTTSTSYLLLSSLDAARRNMVIDGERLLSRAMQLADGVRAAVRELPYIRCVGSEVMQRYSSVVDMDPTKLCFSVRRLGVTGRAVERTLRERFGIEVEMSDLFNVLCLLTVGDEAEDAEALVSALTAIAEEAGDLGAGGLVRAGEIAPIYEHELVLPPRTAFWGDVERVPLEQAVHRVAAEFVMVYPPGIPLLVPGERITPTDVGYIRQHQAWGYPIQGPEDETIATIRVVR